MAVTSGSRNSILSFPGTPRSWPPYLSISPPPYRCPNRKFCSKRSYQHTGTNLLPCSLASLPAPFQTLIVLFTIRRTTALLSVLNFKSTIIAKLRRKAGEKQRARPLGLGLDTRAGLSGGAGGKGSRKQKAALRGGGALQDTPAVGGGVPGKLSPLYS